MLHLFGQLKAAAIAVDKAKADSTAKYKQLVLGKLSKAELPAELQNLTTWLEDDATYRLCQTDLTEKTQLYNQARAEYYGEGVLEVNDLLAKLASAKEYLKPESGLNMPCTSSSESWAQRLKEAQSGQNSSSSLPPDIFYKPKYSLDNYKETVELWSRRYEKNTNVKTIFALALDELSDIAIDWGSLGFPNIDSNKHDEGIPPKDTILSLSTGNGTLTPKVEDVIISVTDLQVFDIYRGEW
ncbi:hypothetical protein ABW20_dc0103667 [Dactylellina cionopaga]|nr:hypothetical protein ABW20_dc0103667 [Dactylellina cionopaga]